MMNPGGSGFCTVEVGSLKKIELSAVVFEMFVPATLNVTVAFGRLATLPPA